jgi:dienelactone hydrolase
MIEKLMQNPTSTLAIPACGVRLTGDLTLPSEATGLVVFAHGSGSSRLSPRNRQVAAALQESSLATLLFDLLTPEEEEVDAVTHRIRFDINMLSIRLADVTDWLMSNEQTRGLQIGYFGASTGAAAALVAAALRPKAIRSVVSRGGRADLAGRFLPLVRAPTLLIVGSGDRAVLGMNEEALRKMKAAKTHLAIVPGATHLFEEPGALEEVCRLARRWFEDTL